MMFLIPAFLAILILLAYSLGIFLLSQKMKNFSFHDLGRFSGFLIGLVVSTIGSIMILSELIGYHILDLKMSHYEYENIMRECDPEIKYAYELDRFPSKDDKDQEKIQQLVDETTTEDIAKCVKKRTDIAKNSGRYEMLETVLNGGVMTFVGGILLVIFRRRKSDK